MASLRSLLYTGARLLGDLRALQRGPRAILTRIIRKAAWRLVGGFINRIK